MILTVNGKALNILEPEPKGTETDPSLFFIHGAGGNGEIWEEQAAVFKGKHLAYRPDLPGHGGSGPLGEGRISAYAEAIRPSLEKLFPKKPFVLVGRYAQSPQGGSRRVTWYPLPLSYRRCAEQDSTWTILR